MVRWPRRAAPGARSPSVDRRQRGRTDGRGGRHRHRRVRHRRRDRRWAGRARARAHRHRRVGRRLGDVACDDRAQTDPHARRLHHGVPRLGRDGDRRSDSLPPDRRARSDRRRALRVDLGVHDHRRNGDPRHRGRLEGHALLAFDDAMDGRYGRHRARGRGAAHRRGGRDELAVRRGTRSDRRASDASGARDGEAAVGGLRRD